MHNNASTATLMNHSLFHCQLVVRPSAAWAAIF